MTTPDLFADFEARGLVHQSTDAALLREWLAVPGRRVYAGFDPTADSLHVGHLVALVLLRRVAHDTAPDLRDLRPDLPPALADLVASLLAKTPAARVRDAESLAQALSTLAQLPQAATGGPKSRP